MEGLILVLLLIAVFVGYPLANRALKQRRSLMLQEMAHRERLVAMEKGIPVAELPDAEEMNEAMTGGEMEIGAKWATAGNGRALRWIRLAALGVGLLSLFTGIGWYCALILVPDTPQTHGLPELASLGLIGVLGGIGLLLFFAITRNMEV